MNLDEVLDEMERNGSNLETIESYEMENYIIRNKGKFPTLAKQVAVKRQERNDGVHLGKFSDGGKAPAAQFDIVATRNTGNINATLPVVLFGANDAENGYRSVITLPTGVTLTSVRYGENASQSSALRFTYTDGVGVDTIDVTCSMYPYPSFLQATKFDLFQMTKMRFSVSDSTVVAQLSQSVSYRERGIFGTDKTNPVSMTAAKTPTQFQTTIIDVNGSFDIDKESMLITGMIKNPVAATAYSYTLSAFVRKAFKYNSNKGF